MTDSKVVVDSMQNTYWTAIVRVVLVEISLIVDNTEEERSTALLVMFFVSVLAIGVNSVPDASCLMPHVLCRAVV